MRNITVSVSEEVYRQARIRAAERDTSVSAMVREFLVGLRDEESDFERRKRLQDDVISSVDKFSARDRLRRDDLHRRNAIR